MPNVDEDSRDTNKIDYNRTNMKISSNKLRKSDGFSMSSRQDEETLCHDKNKENDGDNYRIDQNVLSEIKPAELFPNPPGSSLNPMNNEKYDTFQKDQETLTKELITLQKSSSEISAEIQKMRKMLVNNQAKKSELYAILDYKNNILKDLKLQVWAQFSAEESIIVENKELKKDRRAINSELSKLLHLLEQDEIEIHELKAELEAIVDQSKTENVNQKRLNPLERAKNRDGSSPNIMSQDLCYQEDPAK